MAKNDFDCTTLTPEQRDARLALDVERLLRFGRKHKLIKELDELVARNTLLDLLQLAAPSETKPPKEDPATQMCIRDRAPVWYTGFTRVSHIIIRSTPCF